MIPTPYKHLPGKTQKLAIGAASVSSTAFGAQTYAIRVAASGACHIELGPSPVATASSAFVAPNVRGEFIGVSPGEKLAVIDDGTVAGNLYITELSR